MNDASVKKAVTPRPVGLTMANKITIIRIVLIPVIVIGLLQNEKRWVYVLLIFSMLTDFLDGVVARWRGERTHLGAFLDPLADKLLLTAVYITLTYLKLIQMWMFVVIFSRDLLIVLGWGIIYILTGSSGIAPRLLGKLATAAQMANAFAVIISIPFPIQNALLWTAVALTVASAIDYVLVGEKRLGSP